MHQFQTLDRLLQGDQFPSDQTDEIFMLIECEIVGNIIER
jgi:hypothetical protein